jgi:hypothetical protein
VYVNTTAAIADLLYSDQYADLEATEQAVGKRLVIRAMPSYHCEQYEVYAR